MQRIILNKKLVYSIISILLVTIIVISAIVVAFSFSPTSQMVEAGKDAQGYHSRDIVLSPDATKISSEVALKAWLRMDVSDSDAYREAILIDNVSFNHDGNYTIVSGRTLHGGGYTINLNTGISSTTVSTSTFDSPSGYKGANDAVWSSGNHAVTLRGGFLYELGGTLSNVLFDVVSAIDVNETQVNYNGNHALHGVIVGRNSGLIDNVHLDMAGYYKIQVVDRRGTYASIGGIAGGNSGTIKDSSATYGQIGGAAARLEAYTQSWTANPISYSFVGGVVGKMEINGNLYNVKTTINNGIDNIALYSHSIGKAGGWNEPDIRVSESYVGGAVGIALTGKNNIIDGVIVNDLSTANTGDGGAFSIKAFTSETGRSSKGVIIGLNESKSIPISNLYSVNANDASTGYGVGLARIVIDNGDIYFEAGDSDNLHFAISNMAENEIIFSVNRYNNGNGSNNYFDVYDQYIDNTDKTITVAKTDIVANGSNYVKLVKGTFVEPVLSVVPTGGGSIYGTPYAFDMSSVITNIPNFSAVNLQAEYTYVSNSTGAAFAPSDIMDVGEYTVKISNTTNCLYVDKANRLLVKRFANQSDYTRESFTVSPKPVSLKGVEWDYTAGKFVYDNSEKTVSLNKNIENVTITYGGTFSAINASSNYNASVTITANENYIINDSQIQGLNWTIEKADYDMTAISFEGGNFIYNGGLQSVEIAGTLPSGVTVAYVGGDGELFNSITNVSQNNSEITAKFTGADIENFNLINDLTATIAMVAAEVSVQWVHGNDGINKFVYNGDNQSSSVTAKYVPTNTDLVVGDMIITVPSDFTNVDSGKAYTFTASLPSGNFKIINSEASDVAMDYFISQALINIDSLVWQSNLNLEYNGFEQKVTLANVPSTISISYVYEGIDSNVSTNVGDYYAYAKLTAKDDLAGNYMIEGGIDGVGSTETAWSIVQGVFDWSIVNFESGDLTYSGYEQTIVADEYSANVAGGGLITVNYINNVFTDASSSTQSVTANFEFANNGYINPTHSIVIFINVLPYEVDVTWSAGNVDADNFLYNGCDQFASVNATYPTLGKDASLTGGSLEIELQQFINARLNGYKFVGNLTSSNYIIKGANTQATKKYFMNAIEISLAGVSWDYEAGKFVYDGSEKTVSINGNIENVTITYGGIFSATQAGLGYQATVTITANANYVINDSPIEPINWSIEKADYDMKNILFANGGFIYNGELQTIEVGGTLPNGVTVTYTGGNGNTFNGITNVAQSDTVITAIFSGDTDNYNLIGGMSANIIMQAFDIKIFWGASDFIETGIDQSAVVTAYYTGFEGEVKLSPVCIDGEMITYKKGGYKFTVDINNNNYIVQNALGEGYNIFYMKHALQIINPEHVTSIYTRNSITINVKVDDLDKLEFSIDGGEYQSHNGHFSNLSEMTEYIIKVRMKGDVDIELLPSEPIIITVTTFYTCADYDDVKDSIGDISLSSYDNIVELTVIFNRMSEVDKVFMNDDLTKVVAEYNMLVKAANAQLDVAKQITNSSNIPIAVALAMIGLVSLAGVVIKRVGGGL